MFIGFNHGSQNSLGNLMRPATDKTVTLKDLSLRVTSSSVNQVTIAGLDIGADDCEVLFSNIACDLVGESSS